MGRSGFRLVREFPAFSGIAGVFARPPELEAQISRALQEVTIPERVLSWLLERVTRVLQAEEDRRRQVHETLEKTRGEVRRESETLLSLRLRDLITDHVFVARKADLDARMGDFEARLSAPPKSPDEVVRLTADVFRFASRAAEVFHAGSGVQKRMILEAVGSKYTLKGREVAFSLKNPFSRIARARASSDWWTCGDDVRTWIQNTTEDVGLPELDQEPASTGSTYHDCTILTKGGGGPGPRTSGGRFSVLDGDSSLTAGVARNG